MAARELNKEEITEEITRLIKTNLLKKLKRFYFDEIYNSFFSMMFETVYSDEDLVAITIKINPIFDEKIIKIFDESVSKTEIEKSLPHFHNEFELISNISKNSVREHDFPMDIISLNVFILTD